MLSDARFLIVMWGMGKVAWNYVASWSQKVVQV